MNFLVHARQDQTQISLPEFSGSGLNRYPKELWLRPKSLSQSTLAQAQIPLLNYSGTGQNPPQYSWSHRPVCQMHNRFIVKFSPKTLVPKPPKPCPHQVPISSKTQRPNEPVAIVGRNEETETSSMSDESAGFLRFLKVFE